MAIDKTTVFTIVLVLLVVISGVQAVQLSSINGDVSGGKTVSSGSSTPATSGSGDSGRVTTPTSIQNLPKMVGGC